MTNFFIVCVLVLPWVFLPINGVTNQFRLPQGMFLNLTFMGMIFYYFLNGAKNVYRNKYLAFFAGYLLLNTFINFFIPFGIERTDADGKICRMFNFWLLEPMFHIFLGLFATYIALSCFEKEDYIRIAKAVCWSAAFMGLWSVLQYIGFDPFGPIARYNCENKVSACLDNPNLVGNYLALAIPFFFMFLKDKKYLVMMALALAGVYVAKSHFAIGLTALSFVLYALLKYRNKKVIIFAIIIMMIMGGVILKYDYLKLNNGLSGRLDCWKYSLEKAKISPLFGQSLGKFKTYEFKTFLASDPLWQEHGAYTIWFNTHNDWLQYTIEIGLVGMFLFFLVVFNSIKRFTFKNEFGLSYLISFITFLLMMIGSFPLEVPALSMLGLIAFWGTESL